MFLHVWLTLACVYVDVQEFYCELCDKQYKTVGEMSNHYSSYDHHHTKVHHKANTNSPNVFMRTSCTVLGVAGGLELS